MSHKNSDDIHAAMETIIQAKKEMRRALCALVKLNNPELAKEILRQALNKKEWFINGVYI